MHLATTQGYINLTKGRPTILSFHSSSLVFYFSFVLTWAEICKHYKPALELSIYAKPGV